MWPDMYEQIEERCPPPWADMTLLQIPSINMHNVHLVAEALIQQNTIVAKALEEELKAQLNNYNHEPKGVS
jgi:hypothetical protein